MQRLGFFSIRTTLACALLSALAGCVPAPQASLAQRQTSWESLENDVDDDRRSQLLRRIDRALTAGKTDRRLNTEQNAAWQIFHGVIPYGQDLLIDTPEGTFPAVEFAFQGGLINGFELMPGDFLPRAQRQGLKARLEPGSYESQGHVDQWLAIFAMAEIPSATPITLGETQFTVEDLARQAQYDVTNNLLDEYGWTLIGLTYYFPDEPRWPASGGVDVSWEVMVEQELATNINLGACGGTHQLAGVVRALQAKERLGLADSPTWTLAQDVVAEQLELAKQGRGSTGSFSSYYFDGPSKTADLSAQLASAGHLFEFATIACTDDELRAPWVTVATERLCDLLERTAAIDLDCGAYYHALHGLKLYRKRIADQELSQS